MPIAAVFFDFGGLNVGTLPPQKSGPQDCSAVITKLLQSCVTAFPYVRKI
jgi:hypothetical protein